MHITQGGKAKKFVHGDEEHVGFSGKYAVKRGQKVMQITERCVFVLTEKGLELTEIAPDIDLQRHILDTMDFMPIMNGHPRLMDRRIFGWPFYEPIIIRPFLFLL